MQVGADAVKGLLGSAATLAGIVTIEQLGGSKQRPPPAVLAAVTVGGIDKVLGDDAGGHLETGDVAVEAAAHLRTVEAAEGAQFAGDEAAVLGEGQQDGLLNTAVRRR